MSSNRDKSKSKAKINQSEKSDLTGISVKFDERKNNEGKNLKTMLKEDIAKLEKKKL